MLNEKPGDRADPSEPLDVDVTDRRQQPTQRPAVPCHADLERPLDGAPVFIRTHVACGFNLPKTCVGLNLL